LYSATRLAARFVRYYITASNGKGHGIHSPFVFDFITNVVRDKRSFYAYTKIEDLRRRLLTDDRRLLIEDFGAGSVSGPAKQRTVAALASKAAKSKKYGQLLFRMVNYYHPASIIELGTSLGISASYLAMGNPDSKFITMEGATAVAAVARENFSQLGIQNIGIAEGNFDTTLPAVLKNTGTVDLAFIDGNHRRKPTLDYFEQILEKINYPGILIFDDIHWSKEMESAWQEIKKHPACMLTIDLFFIGIVFFSTDFKVKQHFVIRF